VAHALLSKTRLADPFKMELASTMKIVSVAEAQAQLPELVRLVEAGEEVKLVRKKKESQRSFH
jgi:hypothetical protein